MPGYRKGFYSSMDRALMAEEARVKEAREKLRAAHRSGFEPDKDLTALLTAYTRIDQTVPAIDLLSKVING